MMAEGKKKIVVYADWINNFEDLTDEELGKLMRHFFMYVNDMNPVLEDRLLKIAWKPMESTLKRDLKKWESFVDKQKANGKKGGRPKSQKTQAFKEEPKKADSVSVSDNVNDNDNKEKGKKSLRFTPPSLSDVFNYFLEKEIERKVAQKESQAFVNYYDSKGWIVGRSKMKNWKSAVSGWINRMDNFKKDQSNNKPKFTVNR